MICEMSIHFQDSLKKFREEADKLEQSEALQKAREKYVCFSLAVILMTFRDIEMWKALKVKGSDALCVWFNFSSTSYILFQESIESETAKGSEAIKQTFSTLQEKLKEVRQMVVG